MPQVYLSRRAEKDLRALPANVRERFIVALDALEAGAIAKVDVRPLEGTSSTWRLRVGRYRGIFERRSDGLWFTRFAHRSKVYRP